MNLYLLIHYFLIQTYILTYLLLVKNHLPNIKNIFLKIIRGQMLKIKESYNMAKS